MKKYFLHLLSILLITSCTTYNPTVLNNANILNTARIYNPSSSNIFPEYLVVHPNDSLSNVLIRIHTNELTYAKNAKTSVVEATLVVKYKLFSSLEKETPIDTGTVTYPIQKAADAELTVFLKLHTPEKKRYFVEILTMDMVRRKPRQAFLELNKTDNDGSQYFYAYSKKEDKEFFRNYFTVNEGFNILKYNPVPKKMFVSYYENEFPISTPPFTTTNTVTKLKPDTIKVFDYDSTMIFQPKSRMSFFQTDTAKQTGFATFYFHPYFPYIRTSDQMIRPLKYITTSTEYRNFELQKNKKLALDEFWLKAGVETVHTRELIRVYYSRVVFANVYFTSNTEGWRTDRGMIYIVFGPPEAVYKYSNAEKWVYGDGRMMNPLTFIFNKTASPYSENHFVLKRMPEYKTIWMEAVGAWRKGQIYNVSGY